MTFEEFAASRVAVLVRLATALSGDLGLAEDLVQEVLLKLHRRWPKMSTVEAPDAYVRRMLINEFLSWRRKWARFVPVADVWLPIGDEVEAPVTHADRDLLRTEIGKLSRPKQVVLTLRYYAGLSDAEIADAMGCNLGTVRSHASRALATLRVEPTLRAEYLNTPLTEGLAP